MAKPWSAKDARKPSFIQPLRNHTGEKPEEFKEVQKHLTAAQSSPSIERVALGSLCVRDAGRPLAIR